MLKKVFVIFIRDIKVNTRDFLTLYLLIVPIIFGIAINLIAPGINDTTVNIAILEGQNEEMETYLSDFSKVSTYKNEDAVYERIERRDDVFGILYENDQYVIIAQGNELEGTVEYVKLMLLSYEEGITLEDTMATIHDFGRDKPPLKRMLVIIFLMFTSVLGGMLIAINIIEEKVDRTIRAIHLSPISRNGYIFGKSMIGMLLPLYGSFAIVLITGYRDIAWGQMLILVLVSMVVSILFGFIQGINNSSVMDAAGSVKMMFFPLAGAVAVIELMQDKWQWIAYWVPFYWTYLGFDAVLTDNPKWGNTILYSACVVAISILVYILLMPRIKKGLQ